MELLIMYLIIINVLGFFAMGIDKERARRKEWRIPEKVFWGIALLGGSVGIWLGMQSFRHKTKHTSFMIGIPSIMFVQWMIFFCSWMYC